MTAGRMSTGQAGHGMYSLICGGHANRARCPLVVVSAGFGSARSQLFHPTHSN